jgi:succinoglycan biosynthesis transport protein ExoP
MSPERLLKNNASMAPVYIEEPLDVIRPTQHGPYPWTESSGNTLREYWRILLKYRWTILAVTAVVTITTTVATFRMTRIYDAGTRIAIYPENSEYMGFKQVVGTSNSEDWDYTVELDTQIGVLKSDALAAQVIDRLSLDHDPRFTGTATPTQTASAVLSPAPTDNRRYSGLIRKLQHGLMVTKVPHTRLIEIRYANSDPRLAAEIANAMASSFIEYNFKTKYDATSQASEWLSRQLADLQLKVQTSEEKLVRYQKENGILGVDEKQNIVMSKLTEINEQLTKAQADRIEREAAYQQLRRASSDSVSADAHTSNLQRLREQEADLQAQIAQMAVQFGPEHPKIRELKIRLKTVENSIERENKNILARAENEYLVALQREKMLQTALDAQKQQANRLNESAVQYSLLKRDADTSRQLYESLMQKMKEAGISAGLRSGNIRVVDVARVPLAPSKPNVPLYLALGFWIGLTGGVVLAFLQERLDNTVRTEQEATLISGLAGLGYIPFFEGSKSTKPPAAGNELVMASGNDSSLVLDFVAHVRPKSHISESYRALRTSILLSSLGNPPKVILLTSGLPQEGKTATSINIAIVLAQKGGRVLLLDADLRRPNIHTRFEIECREGLSTVLTGTSQLEDCIVPTAIKNLFVLPSGPVPPHPAELLASDLMNEQLSRLRQEFDHIVLDTPPVLSVTDAVLLSVQVDCVVLVVRSGKTTKDSLRRTCDLLNQVNAKVAGAVINALDVRSPGSYYYGYYGYYGGSRYYE